MSRTAKPISREELDRRFDDGEDILHYLDLKHPIVEHHPPLQKRATSTMPAWMVEGLDEETNAFMDSGKPGRFTNGHDLLKAAMSL